MGYKEELSQILMEIGKLDPLAKDDQRRMVRLTEKAMNRLNNNNKYHQSEELAYIIVQPKEFISLKGSQYERPRMVVFRNAQHKITSILEELFDPSELTK
ncbi:MAG: hypothetical protein IH946_03560 [Bacteroidetes bacterium]|nr:hypothetical protein [Bacteroidota bacterium]